MSFYNLVVMIDLATIDEPVEMAEGIPRPRWDVIGQWIEANTPSEEWNDVWSAAAKQWLELVQSTWGGSYAPFRSSNFLMLTADAASSGEILQFCELALKRIKTALPDAASDAGFGPHVLIACADHGHYYDYVSYFYGDGDWATSGGMFIDGGYGHIVLPPTPYYWRETVAHEMTHSLLRHLPIPAWLNEGLAMTMEGIVTGREPGWPPLEELYRLRDFWPQRGIQDFWTGASFSDPEGDGQELSYLLARCLARRVAEDHPKSFLPFVRSAEWNDAGDAAARVHFKRGIGPILAEILGDGDWNPRQITA